MHSTSPSRPFSVLNPNTATCDVEIPAKDTDLKFAGPEEHRSVRDLVNRARARSQTVSANLLSRTRNLWGVQIVMFGEFVAGQVFFLLFFWKGVSINATKIKEKSTRNSTVMGVGHLYGRFLYLHFQACVQIMQMVRGMFIRPALRTQRMV